MKMRSLKMVNVDQDVLKLPKATFSLQEMKMLCKKHGIKNSVDYKMRYKEIPGLVSHPERMFPEEWVSYSDFFDTSEFYTYEEVVYKIKDVGIKSQTEYKKYIKGLDDPRFPFDPQGVYEEKWKNWYKFLSKEEPFNVEFILPEFKKWRVKIDEFMKQALGGSSKKSYLCRFVRVYIEKHDGSTSPQEFLTKQKVNIKPFRDELDKFSTDNMRRNVILSVNEFFEYIIATDLTVEDEETGEVFRLMDARNPFEFMLTDSYVSSPGRSESTKPCLQYHFVRKTQSWIIPESARNFRDLRHLHEFDPDWVRVESHIIDKDDPDCVYKKIGPYWYLWVPIDWLHTFALTKVPLRGRQIAYNDSGEADEYIPVIGEAGRIAWVKNYSEMAGMTKSQSFIKRYPDDQIGMFVTTNKTSSNNCGYSIPWLPEDLAYWLIRLREWQEKYNPIDLPTSWSQCKRTNLNEIQLKSKGVNCFLFRAFGDVEPKNVGTALTSRLAAAIYHIQPSHLRLSELSGLPNNISCYKSPYTPHSMRVSLITAYVMEMGMPIEIVMKVVGHSSIVMSIYYCKISHGEIRRRLEEGEKIALQAEIKAIQKTIESNKIESVKNQLVSNNEDILLSLTNSVPAGNFVFRDYGICPFAASRCDDGGDQVGATRVRSPVPMGYLGMQNCLRCRHFITGPVFLGGLMSVGNEILFTSNKQSEKCMRLQDEISTITERLEQIDRDEYIANARGIKFDQAERVSLEAEQRKLESEYESAAKKMDMFLCDLQSCYKLIRMCVSTVNGISSDVERGLSLIKMPDSEMEIEIEEVSYFQQLHEICENATIYHSADAAVAIAPRSQLLDRMSVFNELQPNLFMLTDDQQLKVGNQVVNFLRSRLKTWERVSQVVDCSVKLEELMEEEKIDKSELTLILKPQLLNEMSS